jgi:hypothetical protein
MKLAASSLQADLRDIERAVATGTREAAAAARPNSVGRRRSVLIRGKGCVRRCRLVFRDCGAGTGGGLAV